MTKTELFRKSLLDSYYISYRDNSKKHFPRKLVNDLVVKLGPKVEALENSCSYGEILDFLLEYRDVDDSRLLPNHMDLIMRIVLSVIRNGK